MTRKERFVICVETKDEWGRWEENTPIELCPICSAFVYDKISHAYWHANLPKPKRGFFAWLSGRH